MNKTFFLIFLSFLFVELEAGKDFGWHSGRCWGWEYGEKFLKDEENIISTPQTQNISYSKIVDQKQQEFQEALARATLEPSLENVSQVQFLQYELMERMRVFSSAWLMSSLMHPEWNYAATERPTSNFGIQAFEKERRKKREEVIQLFANSSILLYVYDDLSQPAKQMSSIAKSISQKYEWDLVALSSGESAISGIDPCPTPEIFSELHLRVLPALLAIDEEGSVWPVAWSVQTEDQVEQNIIKILENLS